jgi:undecaprenyl-diphosphatase
MSLLSIALLSFIQGLTEFLPVSSSGHLLLSRLLLIPYEQPLTTDVFLHAGSLLAIIWFFRNTIRKNFVGLLPVLIIGTIPAAIAGVFIYDRFQFIFETPQFLGISFLITSFYLFIFSYLPKGKTSLTSINLRQALTIGIFQAVALLPGVSRSGSTIFAGKLAGLKQEAILNFAFLLGIPAIFGAIFMVIKDINIVETGQIKLDLFGLIISFFASLLALKILEYFLRSKNLTVFSIYTLILGSFCLGLFI